MVLVEAASSLTVNGALTNDGTVRVAGGNLTARNDWTSNGTIRVGPGPFIDLKANLAQSATSTFVSTIRSTADDGYGKLIVDGTATLDGTLRIEFEDTYTPSVGDSFAVLQYGNRVGDFGLIEVPSLAPGLQIVAFYKESFLNIVVQQQ
jgi:hypothetical protein